MPLPAMEPLKKKHEKHVPSEGMGVNPLDLGNTPRNSENLIYPHDSTAIHEQDKSNIIETACVAMTELIELFRVNEPLWIKSTSDGRYVLHRDSYDKLFPRSNHLKTTSARFESSKDSGEVAMAAIHLVEMLLDVVMFGGSFFLYMLYFFPI